MPRSHEAATVITTGVSGRPWRASVTPWGAVQPWDGGPGLDWYVAADDRWHVPSHEPSVRQHRVDGTAVVETRVRVPHGDAVQRVYSVADAGGLTVVEVENDSTLPIAVAFDRRDVRTERPVVDVPIEGIELPAGAFVVPVGHRASVRVAIAHTGPATGPLPPAVPTARQVARGWAAITDRASRLLLPDGEHGASLATAVVAERCELVLGSFPHAADDPAGFALALGELVRMGERPDPWLPELVDAVAAVAPVAGWDGDAALAAAERVLVAAHEERARRDLRGLVERRDAAPLPPSPPGGVRSIAWLEHRLAASGRLLPAGIPADWFGVHFEAYGLPVGAASTVSFAVRWHGDRPAVLWEVHGERVELTAPALDPSWRTWETTGETLWPAPVPAAPPAEPAGGSTSFS